MTTDDAPLPSVDLRFGDCLDVLRTLPDESVHVVICDPPYGLAEHRPDRIAAALIAWTSGDREHVPDGRGFMGRAWDAFVPPPAVWDECLRVLKPGGHLAAFAGSRTYDLMGMSIRLAGFEIRDGLQWLYGSGMPKGQNVGKAVDKQRDDRADIVAVTTYLAEHAEARGITRADVDEHMGTSDMGGWWLSRLVHRCQVPRWEQWERLRELLGFDDEMDAEVWRLNGRKGTPGEAWQTAEVLRTEDRMNEPSGIVNVGQGERTAVTREIKAPNSPEAARWEGWNTSLKPSQEPIVLARKPLSGTVAANVLAHGTGAINVDACRVGSTDKLVRPSVLRTDNEVLGAGTQVEPGGRWPANVLLTHAPECHEPGECAPGCAVAELDAQSGNARSSGVYKGDGSRHVSSATVGFEGGGHRPATMYDDSGGASRFFPSFRYQAKAPASERPKIDGKGWPTVKPQGLMRWLVRLLTPPGGVVLDPFAGTSATLQAARDEGFASIGVERDEFAYLLSCRRLGLPEVVPGTVADAETGEPVSLVDVAKESVQLTPVTEDVKLPEPVLVLDPVLAAIADALDYEALRTLWVEHRAIWTDEHTAAAKARRAALDEAAA